MTTPRHAVRRRRHQPPLWDAALLVGLVGLVGLGVALVLTIGAGGAWVMLRLALGV